jgi:hypothetical protein
VRAGSNAACTDWKEAPNQAASAFKIVKAQSLAIADGALFMSCSVVTAAFQAAGHRLPSTYPAAKAQLLTHSLAFPASSE